MGMELSQSLQLTLQNSVAILTQKFFVRKVMSSRFRFGQFIQILFRPRQVQRNLEAAYRQMAQDQQREVEALGWSEALIGDAEDSDVAQEVLA